MVVHRIQMPQLGETVAEATVVAWLKRPGDEVAAQEPLLEVSSDKVDTEVPSTIAGVVKRLLVDEGQTVDVGTTLAEIETAAAGPTAPAGDGAGDTRTSRPASELVSPLVRRLVAEHGLDLEELKTYAGGERLSRKVLERFLAERAPAPPPAPVEADRAPVEVSRAPVEADRAPVEADHAPVEAAGEFVPYTRIRARTAEHMVRSVHTSAHVLTAIEVDFERVARLRRERKEAFVRRHGAPLTFLAFVATATARTLRDAPRLNAQVVDGGVRLLRDVHLGIAVDLDAEGLIVPVIRSADRLRLPAIASAIADRAARARAGDLRPDDVTGGTFTISSQGPYGTLLTGAIINQPQVAILSVDGIRKRPVVVEHEGQDLVVARHTGVLGLSWDHRALNGVDAARFLAALRDRIEGTDWTTEID